MRRGAFLVIAAIALSACGGDEQARQAKDPCLLVRTGEKLCGEDATAYCRSFVDARSPQQDVTVCRGVGVKIGETIAERRERGAAEERKRAEKVRGYYEDGDEIVPFVKRVMGDQADLLSNILVLNGEVEVRTLFNIPGDPDTKPAPGVLERMCTAALRNAPPDLAVYISDDSNKLAIRRCNRP